jgi:hypothetical protein
MAYWVVRFGQVDFGPCFGNEFIQPPHAGLCYVLDGDNIRGHGPWLKRICTRKDLGRRGDGSGWTAEQDGAGERKGCGGGGTVGMLGSTVAGVAVLTIKRPWALKSHPSRSGVGGWIPGRLL